MSAPVLPEEIGRAAHAGHVADAVRKAMAHAHIAEPDDVHFVQVKCPCVTSARAEAARAAGKTVASADPNRSMALARAAGAFGVSLALGEIVEADVTDTAFLQNFSVQSDRASISSGVEVEVNEVIVLGNSPLWSGDLQIAHRPMSDALDIGAVVQVLADLEHFRNSAGGTAGPQPRAGGVRQMRAGSPRAYPRAAPHHARRDRYQRAAAYPRRVSAGWWLACSAIRGSSCRAVRSIRARTAAG